MREGAPDSPDHILALIISAQIKLWTLPVLNLARSHLILHPEPHSLIPKRSLQKTTQDQAAMSAEQFCTGPIIERSSHDSTASFASGCC
jgi:hypothetical protein